MNRRIAYAAPLLALALALTLLASPALGATSRSGAIKLRPAPFLGAKGRSGSSGCTQAAPSVAVDNTWGWGQWGSWGLAGQERMYSVHVMNNDVGCGSSSFVINMSAPAVLRLDPDELDHAQFVLFGVPLGVRHLSDLGR